MDKTDLLDTIRTSHRQLERYLFYFEKNEDGAFVASHRPKFGKDEMLRPGVVGEWSLRDLLFHLTDWERRFISWYRAGERGKLPEVPSADWSWEELDTADCAISTAQNVPTIEEMLAEFQDSYHGILAMVEAFSEKELLTPGHYGWTGNAALADYVALTTYKHYAWAKSRIRRWRKTHAGRYLNKQVVLERVVTERRRLEGSLATLDKEEMTASGVVGEWSVKDIMAHLMDWEQRFLSWYEAGRRGEVPKTPAPGMGWGELDLLNQQIYQKHRYRTLADVRVDFEVSYQQILAVVKGMPEAEMFAVGRYAWLADRNLLDYILANTANHYRWATKQIRQWLKITGHRSTASQDGLRQKNA